MKTICIICEGAYPYIVGGVSSWVHEIITSNPEYNFKILCIIPNKEFAQLKYELPKNVIGVENIILNPEIDFSVIQVLKNKFMESKDREEAVKELLTFNKVITSEALEIVEKIFEKNIGKPLEVILSKDYWNALVENYEKNYSGRNFNIYYWTYRNIVLNLILIGQNKIPEADIYHPVATGYAGYVAALAAHRKMGRVVLTEHGIYPREREEEIIIAKWIDKEFKSIWIEYFYYLSKLAYEYSDVIISLFEYNRQAQIENGADEKKTMVIPNGIDGEVYNKIQREKRSGFNVGSVLRVVPIKDVKMMIKGFKLLTQRVEDTKLWIIGPYEEDRDYYEECLQLVKDLDLEDKVVFTGRVDVKEYYKFLDVMILSSISEGQPLSILEAMAAGIPVISTDVGNCREVIKGWKDIGEAGSVIPPTSYTALGEELIKYAYNPERIREYGENGKRIVLEKYKKSYYINKYKEIYRELGERKWQE